LMAALMLALTMSFGSMAAFAAPITCPGKQEPVKTADGWACQNPPATNTTGAEQPKNKNVDKFFF
jgi:hypothetical protein